MKQLKIATDAKVKRLLISAKRPVTSKFLGNYRSVFKGRGVEFEGYRAYTPDDDAGLIDWRASIRADELLVRDFVEERNLAVFFLIDCSSSMILSSTGKLKSEYAAELVAALAFAVLSSGDSVGFAMFTAKPVFQSQPGNGMKEHHRLVDALVNPRLYGGSFDFSEAGRFLLSRVAENTIVFIVSDFVSPGKLVKKELGLLSQKFDIICIMVRDPLDNALPTGMGYVMLKDPFSPKSLLVEPNSMAGSYREEARRQASAVRKELEEKGCDFLQLATNQPFTKPLLEFFAARLAKWR